MSFEIISKIWKFCFIYGTSDASERSKNLLKLAFFNKNFHLLSSNFGFLIKIVEKILQVFFNLCLFCFFLGFFS